MEPQELYDFLMQDPKARGYPQMSFEGKQTGINEIRTDVTVQLTTPKNVGPGKVNEPIPVQLVRDAITYAEYLANLQAEPGDTSEVIAQKEAERDWIDLIIGGSAGESLLGFTDLLKTQIVQTFPNNDWPDTRVNLTELQIRDGSDSEGEWGISTTRDDMLDAEQYATDNGLPSLYLN